jgi:hypothetical protein
MVATPAGSVRPGIDQVNKLKNFAFNLGGFGGAQGNGGDVTVFQRGASVSTEGAGATAIFAQSVGGGGGRGGAGAGGLTNPSIAVGGVGGAGGDGGNVTVNVLDGARITTRGATTTPGKPEDIEGGAFGIFAQSVGGGGGVGGNARMFGIPAEAGNAKGCDEHLDDPLRGILCGRTTIGVGLPLVGPGGAGGNGGKVNVTVRGDITTTGDHAAAIFAQSVGGGGGVSGASAITPFNLAGLNTVLIGSGPSAGSAGAVSIDYRGKITTSGDGAHGIFAQSAGGGMKTPDGQPGLRSRGGDVTIDFTGNLVATGREAFGIMAQSAGADGNGNIESTVERGSSVRGGQKGGTNNGAGIMFADGNANLLTNYGTITSSGGVAVAHCSTGGCATKGPGSVSVVNFGVIIGNQLLGRAPAGCSTRPGRSSRPM